MKRLISLIYKDFLLLVRDRAGLIFLFVMPLVLVIVMTGMQEGAFENSSSKSVSLLILNADQDEIGASVTDEMSAQDLFAVTMAEPSTTEADVQQMVKRGDYLVGIVIQENTTAKIQGNIQKNVAAAFAGLPQSVAQAKMDTVSIKVYLDPTLNSTFRTTLLCQLREASTAIQNRYMFDKISEEVNERAMLPMGEFSLSAAQPVGIEEVAYGDGKSTVVDGFDATAHNVPAWTLFAIFFIVISLSGNIIKERQDGSFARLMTMPCPYPTYLLSKVLVYAIVCLLQFLLVLAMGKWLFPVVGLPAFDMHGNFGLCLVVVLCAALAAIGFGLLISAFATTHQQASIFGAVSVVILSAIGGIWVPTFLMPKFLKALSAISPLNWGIEAFYDLVLRDGDFASILPQCLLLLGFAVVCFVISVLAKSKKSF